MNRIIIVILLYCLFSCSHKRNEEISKKDTYKTSIIYGSDQYSNHSLMLLIDSGYITMRIQDSDTIFVSKSQIIYCTQTSLKYGYGSVYTETDSLKYDIEWFSDYSEIKDYAIVERELDINERKFIETCIKELSHTKYVDPEIIKDDWEYILYVDNFKVASGYVGAIDSFPKKIYEIIQELLVMAAPLYPLNDLS